MKLGIIADDFTGANDIALQLVKYGIKAKSYINIEEISGDFVYTSETRNASEDEARKKLEIFFETIKKHKVDRLYKKIDSTLRGNIKVELDIFLKYIGENEKIAIILPFPKVGRVVKNGKLYVNDIELKDTTFAKDPYWNLLSSDLKDYFDGVLISIDDIRNEKFSEILFSKKEKVLIFEGENDKDLELIAKTLSELNLDKNIVGSAGIMEYLLKNWGYEKEKVMIVAGSCNETNIKQTDNFIQEFKPSLYDFYIDENKILIYEEKESNCIVFRTIRDEKKSSKSREELNLLISEKVKNLSNEKNINKICLSGGDISIAFMDRFEINEIEVLSEIEPGIAFGLAGKYRLVTKPGGFGSEKIYKKIYSFLKNYR